MQVSRLGMPLVNEVVIGLKDKDRFNASKPGRRPVRRLRHQSDAAGAARGAVRRGGRQAPNNFPRNDLVATFLTGISGVNQPKTVTPAEMLRLNTAIAADRGRARRAASA